MEWKERVWPAAMVLSMLACGSNSQPTPSEQLPQGQRPRQAPPEFQVGGFSIDLPPVTLRPGEEVQPCTIFPLTPHGPSHIVGGAKLTV